MVTIRFLRVGKPHINRFRLVATDARKGPQSPPLEILGSYDPRAKDGEKIKNLKKERLEHWVKVGAQLSESVERLFKKEKLT